MVEGLTVSIQPLQMVKGQSKGCGLPNRLCLPNLRPVEAILEDCKRLAFVFHPHNLHIQNPHHQPQDASYIESNSSVCPYHSVEHRDNDIEQNTWQGFPMHKRHTYV